MKIEVKELKKLVDNLVKEDVSLINIMEGQHCIEARYVTLGGDVMLVKLSEEGSGLFSKVIKETLF